MHALELSDPQVIGPYRLLGRLGAGGMGQVYLGLSAGGRLVAVKVIRAELAVDPEFRTRFRREIAAARKVSGLFTASVVDADTDGPMPWLATVYVAGPSLAQAVREHGPLLAGSVLALAAGLAEGLTAIHAAGMVHRDLKPSNVLLAEDGPRVIDFGISRAAEMTSMTRAGFVLGSAGYMSPEQAEGRDVGPPSDIFSLGAVLAFGATGEGPFGDGPTAALVYRVVHSPANLDGVPAEVRLLVERCLAKDPSDRPTAADLIAEVGISHLDKGWLPTSLNAALDRYAPPSPPVAAAVTGPAGLSVPGYLPTDDLPARDAGWPTTAARDGGVRASAVSLIPPGDPGSPPPGDPDSRPARGDQRRRAGGKRRRLVARVAVVTAVAAAASAVAAISLAGHPRSQAGALSSRPAISLPPAPSTSRPASPVASRSVRVSVSPRTTGPTAPRTAAPVSPTTTGPTSPSTTGPTAPGTRPSSPPRPANPAAGYAQAVMADRPVAYWQFAGGPGSAGYADSSGNGNALPAGLTVFAAPGTPKLAGGISTANGGTNTTTSLSPVAGDAPRTVEAWFRTTSTGCIFSAGSAAHAQAFSLCLRAGPVNVPTPGAPGVYFETYDADIFVPIGNLTDGTWHYIAVTVSGNMIDIVIDGTQPQGYIWNGNPQMAGGGAYTGLTAQPFALPYTPDTAATPLGVATAGLGGIGGGLVGTMAEVAVYSKALPVSELVKHYRLVAG